MSSSLLFNYLKCFLPIDVTDRKNSNCVATQFTRVAMDTVPVAMMHASDFPNPSQAVITCCIVTRLLAN